MEVSRDWQDPGFVAHYNAHYALSPAEMRPYLDRLGLTPTDALVDFGCGDGTFLALAAPLVSRALGVDASDQQTSLARTRLRDFKNVEIAASDFLRFEPGDRRFTKGFSRKALHHLSDPDKIAFMKRIAGCFAPGARLLLEDAMFTFDRAELPARMPAVLRDAQAYFGTAWAVKQGDFLHSLREEFPTGQEFWIAACAAAGFQTIERWNHNCFLGGLLLRREV
jgi:SAM-dependent methyltransferase